MIQIKLMFMLLLCHECWSQRNPPEYIIPLLRDWSEMLVAPHVIKMTEELIKDAQYKLMHATKVQEKYMHTITYELGTVAAGIQDVYKHMLGVYRTYSKMEAMYNSYYDIYQYLNAYHVVQGDYNQIRLEQKMFYDILEKYERRKEEFNRKLDKMRYKFEKKKGKTGGKRRRGDAVKWKNGEEGKDTWGGNAPDLDVVKSGFIN